MATVKQVMMVNRFEKRGETPIGSAVLSLARLSCVRTGLRILILMLGFGASAEATETAYSAWSQKFFADDPASAEMDADPDGDNLPNVVEYELGTDPTQPTEAPVARDEVVPQFGYQKALTLTVTIRVNDPDFAVVPRTSVDGFQWFPYLSPDHAAIPESRNIIILNQTPVANGMRTIKYGVLPNQAADAGQMIRLDVIRREEGGQTALATTGSVAIRNHAASATAPLPASTFSVLAKTPAIPGLSFTSQLAASMGTSLLSNTITLHGFHGGITVTAPDGVTLIVNGKDAGTSARVKAGDTLALRAVALSDATATASYQIHFGSSQSVLWNVGGKRPDALTVPDGTVSGYTPVSASVGGGGDANISLPITVSPGISGMEPKLFIGYSSQGGNGLLGVGFNLGGLSAISRVGQTIVQDGKRGSVKLDTDDRFALDGARLISVSGGDGSDGTTYEKELHDFSRIRSHGAQGQGPQWWSVETKSGLNYEYGHTEDSRLVPGTGVLTWALSKVRDTVGNEMRYYYGIDEGTMYLKYIEYTVNPSVGADSKCRVDFNYERRPDVKVSYFLGNKFINYDRLASIDCSHDGSIVRRYELTYQQAEISGHSQLIQVLEKGEKPSGTGAWPSFAPTVFTWQQNSTPNMALNTSEQDPALALTGFSRSPTSLMAQGDFNGDGCMDIFHVDDHPENIWVAFGSSTGNFKFQAVPAGFGDTETIDFKKNSTYSRLRTGDFNGDGKTDILNITRSGVGNWMALGQNDGSFVVRRGADLGAFENVGHGGSFKNEVIALDINGDGCTDLIFLNADGNNRVFLAKADASFSEVVVPPGDPLTKFLISDRDATNTFVVPGDFNGDGLGDILLLYNEGYHAMVLSNGDGTFSFRDYTQLGGISGVQFRRTRAAFVSGDFNGDGLTDLSHFDNDGTAWVALCKGDGSFEELAVPSSLQGLPLELSDHSRLLAGDFNGDGISDVFHAYYSASTLGWLVLSKGDDSFATQLAGDLGVLDGQSYAKDEESRVFTGDFDGDGTDDVLHLRYGSSGNFLARSTSYDANRVSQVTNGHGGYSRFEYTPMTHPSVYTKGNGSTYPAYDVEAPIQLVSRIFTTNGVGGETSIAYHYNESIAYLNGRGMLGPRSIVEVNETTGITTLTEQETSNPLLAGFPRHVLTTLSDGTKINEQTNTWVLQQRSNGRTNFAFATSSEKSDYEIKPNAVVKDTVTTIPASSGYDDHGNLLSSKEEVSGGGNTYSTATTNSYSDQVGTNWILGRLTSSTVTKTAPGGSTSTRNSTFAYDSSTGLLTTETIEPNDPKLRLQKVYTHDGVGNITKSVETAWNGSGSPSPNQTRTKSTDYSDDKRFITKTRNDLGHEEITDHEPLLGQVTHQKGPNGIGTFWEFDGFGRPIHELRADGSETRSSYLKADGQTGAPEGAVHCVTTQSSANPAQTIWYDILDREIQRDATGFSGEAISVRKTYNARGETASVSDPFYAGESPAYTTMAYDAISREISRTMPGGRTSTVDYNGLTTTATNSEGQSVTRTATVLDKLATALDDAGKPLTYSRDGAGNLTGVTDASNNQTQLTYDNRGNKIAMTEPNTGTTTCEYNGFGELIAQTPSDGKRTTFLYDTLGRMTQRVEPDGKTLWFYDSLTDPAAGFAAHSIGKLIRSQKGDFREDHIYDDLGRPLQTITRIGKDTFSTNMAYDYVGRVDTITYPTAFAIRNFYNAYGHLSEVQNASSGYSYWKPITVNARGQVENEVLGNGLATKRVFDVDTGWIKSINTGMEGGNLGDIQNLSYDHDSIGGLTARHDNAAGLTETFSHDDLNRVTGATITGVSTDFAQLSFAYDALGNPTSRTDAGTFSYDAAHPHQVTKLTGRPDGPDLRYRYDQRGNRTRTDHRQGKQWVNDLRIAYTAANLPRLLVSERNKATATFAYGPDRARYRQVERHAGNKVLTRLYIGSLYEREDRGATLRHIHYVPAGGGVIAIQQTEEGPSAFGGERTLFVHKDHLGSVETLTDQDGVLVEQMNYDTWGRRRNLTLADGAYHLAYTPVNWKPAANTPRGFTGHEMLDAFGLVHMNGRLYDPLVGRFLSADPIVQELDNLQNLNRYSYVLNNPLSMTDPSGFSFIGKHWKQIAAVVVAVGLAVAAPYLLGGLAELAGSSLFAAGSFSAAVGAGAIAGFGGAFTGTLLAGGSIGDAFRAGAIGGATGALSAGVANGVGTAFSADGQLADYSQYKSLAHGLTQGAISSAEGGKFSHSFLSAGFADLAGGPIDRIKGGDSLHVAERTAAAAVVGGTAEVVGGGKFANGAVTGAFVHLFNDESHRYDVITEVCSTFESGCSRQSVYVSLGESSVYPGQNSPIESGDYRTVMIGPFPLGNILTVADPSNFKYTNYTTEYHLMRDGSVSREVLEIDGSIFIHTVGTGINRSPFGFGSSQLSWVNRNLGPVTFRTMDLQFRNDYRSK